MSPGDVPFMEVETAEGGRIAFSVDAKNRLLLNGHPVVTESRLVLDWWVKLAAIVAAGATAILATVEVGRAASWWQ